MNASEYLVCGITNKVVLFQILHKDFKYIGERREEGI